MATITIFGAGNIGGAVAGIATAGGNTVQVIDSTLEKAQEVATPLGATAGTTGDAITGDIVVLALPYPAIDSVLDAYAGQLDGKIIVETTNPLDFNTFDSLVTPADGSAAAEIQAKVPTASVLKAFNTTFAGTLAAKKVGDNATTVLVVGDSADAKASVIEFIVAGGLKAIDAGSLKRARELEAIGFLQLTLAASEKVSWMGGFAVIE